jgi:hypothetical protein
LPLIIFLAPLVAFFKVVFIALFASFNLLSIALPSFFRIRRPALFASLNLLSIALPSFFLEYGVLFFLPLLLGQMILLPLSFLLNRKTLVSLFYHFPQSSSQIDILPRGQVHYDGFTHAF